MESKHIDYIYIYSEGDLLWYQYLIAGSLKIDRYSQDDLYLELAFSTGLTVNLTPAMNLY